MSRPAISKHIKILTECGLIVIRQQGRERICEARLQQLNDVINWVAQHRKLWTGKLDSLENYLEESQTKREVKNKSHLSPKKKTSIHRKGS